MADFIPPRDAEFALWVENFGTRVAADGTPFGITTAEQSDLADLLFTWNGAFAEHQSAQGAARSRRQAKLLARQSLVEMVRSLARRLQAHPEMTDSVRAEFGLTVPGANAVPNPGVVPTSRPVVVVDTSERLRHLIDWADEQTPTSRRRPAGVRGTELWIKIDGEPPADVSELSFLAVATRPRFVAHYAGEHANKPVHYMLRWISTRGQAGPWSQTITATIGG